MLVGRIASQTDNIILKDFPQLMTEYFQSSKDEHADVRRQVAYTCCKLMKNADKDSDMLLNIQTTLVELLRDSDTLVRQNVVDKLGDKIIK